MPNKQLEEAVLAEANTDQKRNKGAAAIAIEKAKAKAARLRLMKERNENYLAEREVDDSDALEIRVMTD